MARYDEADSKRIAKSVMEVEMAIAKASSTKAEMRDLVAMYNIYDTEQLKRRYDAIDWDAYASSLGIALPEKICICQPKQMECVNKLLKRLKPQTIRDYLSFNMLNSAADYLSDDFVALSFEIYGEALMGKKQQQPRWKRALALPNEQLGEAVGELYVGRYFPESYKAKVQSIITNLEAALSQHIDQLDWMSDETKEKALEKLSTVYVKVGYPDKWMDYSSLEIDPEMSYWESVKRVGRWVSDDSMKQIGQPVDREKWLMTPQTVNAYYNPTTNEICFTAAILQPPFFNPNADDAVNYGAIGVVIGHELTHGFDDQGRQFDKDGNMRDWWTKADAKAFNALTKVLVKQFDEIEVLPNLKANGELTLGENIADQGGLRVAYTAMKMAQGGVEPKLIDGFTADKRFYLGYASLWAQHIRDEEAERLTNTDPHSLGRYRVNQTLKNIDTFYEAFGIESGDMYLAPEERVVIW